MRLSTLILTGLLLTATGCKGGWGTGRTDPPSAPPVKMPEPTTQPVVAVASNHSPVPPPAGADQSLMATVNGKPIYMDALVNPLIETRGLMMAEMLIANNLVAQEAARKKVVVTPEDILAERIRALEGVFGDDIPPAQRDRMLTKLLLERGLTRELWRASLIRNAALHKMAIPRVRVTEAMIRARFTAEYGLKVQVAHIQMPSLVEADKILKLIKAGGDFAELARRYSTNVPTARNDGVLPPFARDDARLPKALRETAFGLKEGQVSATIQTGSEFHVIKLIKRIVPPEANFEKVKDSLRQSIKDGLIKRVRAELLGRLRSNASVDYVNPALKKALNRAASGTP